ncbi:MAG TPA: magnesium/cobalt transporter CorA [Vicinamibacterales bacterium]
MINVYIHRNGQTTRGDRVEAAWLDPSSDVTLWVDLAAPTDNELRVLGDVFHFHPLAVDDATSALQYPKIEPYQGFLYLVLHGIDSTPKQTQFATRDIDFFLGRNFLVTVHDGQSRSIAHLREVCSRHEHVLAEGPVALLHRIVDTMVDNYRPMIEQIEDRIGQLEEQAFSGHERMARHVMKLKREVASMRRVLIPQRDAIGRLARREFPVISDEMAYRFRDVYDHVVRFTEEAILFQDRVTGIFEVNLSTVSHRLNQVMKLLTVMSTIFLPLTVLTSMWGMNIPLPHFPGGENLQFVWITGIMAVVSLAMIALFRRNRWI